MHCFCDFLGPPLVIFVNFHKISSKTDTSKTTTPGQQPADRAPDPRPDSAEHFLVSSDVPPRKCRVAPNQHLASSKDNVSVDKCQARGAPKMNFQKSPTASPQHHGHGTQKENQPFFFFFLLQNHPQGSFPCTHHLLQNQSPTLLQIISFVRSIIWRQPQSVSSWTTATVQRSPTVDDAASTQPLLNHIFALMLLPCRLGYPAFFSPSHKQGLRCQGGFGPVAMVEKMTLGWFNGVD